MQTKLLDFISLAKILFYYITYQVDRDQQSIQRRANLMPIPLTEPDTAYSGPEAVRATLWYVTKDRMLAAGISLDFVPRITRELVVFKSKAYVMPSLNRKWCADCM